MTATVEQVFRLLKMPLVYDDTTNKCHVRLLKTELEKTSAIV